MFPDRSSFFVFGIFIVSEVIFSLVSGGRAGAGYKGKVVFRFFSIRSCLFIFFYFPFHKYIAQDHVLWIPRMENWIFHICVWIFDEKISPGFILKV